TALDRQANRQPCQPEHRDFVPAQASSQRGGNLGEFNRAGTDRVVAKDAVRIGERYGDKGLGAAGLVILPRVATQIFIKLGGAAVEILAVVALADRLFAPDDRAVHAFARRLAAAISAGVGLGGFSNNFRTRFESRSERTMRSERFTTSRATGRILRMMNRATSSCW